MSELKNFTGFTKEEIAASTVVSDIQNTVDRLNDDVLMMSNSNRFTLAERKELALIALIKYINDMISDDYHSEYSEIASAQEKCKNLLMIVSK